MSRTRRRHQRPATTQRFDARAKLHLRVVPTRGGPFHVLTLRPGTDLRFSTNWFHETWHIVTDVEGAQALARLMWGLSYQRAPRTIVLIDETFLQPNPFDAAPSMPIILANAELGSPDAGAVRHLRRACGASARPDRTVRLQTHGLDAAAARWAAHRSDWEWRDPVFARADTRRDQHPDRVTDSAGTIVYRATSDSLRAVALEVLALDRPSPHGDEVFIANGGRMCWWAEGEVQVFANYRRRVSSATIARSEILCSGPVDEETLKPLVWWQGTDVRNRQDRARKEAAKRLRVRDGAASPSKPTPGRQLRVKQPGIRGGA